MSIDWLALAAFLPASLALNLTPGADMMFCLAQGLRGGARPGWAASAGISAGGMVHSCAAGLGLSALIAAHPSAFDVIRWAGVAYLIWLAIKTLQAPFGSASAPGVSAGRAFVQGFVVNLTNPKVILFILAFVPQFVDPDRPIFAQFFAFGVMLALGGLLVNGLVGQFAGHLRRVLGAGGRVEKTLRYLSAMVFAGLALRLAISSAK